MNDLKVYFNRLMELDTYSIINPFHANGLFLYPLKTSESFWFSDIFRGYRKRPVACNRLISIEESAPNETEAAMGGVL